MIFQKTIAIDFDGTITNGDSGSPFDIPEPRKNAVEVINQWYDMGYVIIINTLRDVDPWKSECLKYLKKHGIKYHYFNENSTERIHSYGDVRKIGADIYIDDRNIGGIPNDFVDIDLLVRRQLGDPIQRCDYMAISRMRFTYPTPLRMFSDRFLSQMETSPLVSHIADSIMMGVDEYTIIERLAESVIQLSK